MKTMKFAGEVLKALGEELGKVVVHSMLMILPLYLGAWFVYQEFQVAKLESRETSVYLRALNEQVMTAFNDRTRADMEQSRVNAATVEALNRLNLQMQEMSREFTNLRRRYIAKAGSEVEVDP